MATLFSGLSTDGDLQGVDRLFGALSAHMWPGMVLKSGNKIPISLPMDREGSHFKFLNIIIFVQTILKKKCN